MINRLKKIIKGVSAYVGVFMNGIAQGMIYGNVVNCNGGSVVIEGALF